MKGEPFLKRLGVELTGKPQPPSEEEEASVYGKKTKAAEAKAEYRDTMERLDNPPSIRELQAKREQETNQALQSERERANRLEEERIAKINEERAAAAAAAEEERQKREKAEADLRVERDRALLDKLEKLKGSKKNPIDQLNEYLEFADKLSERFGKKGEAPAKPASEDPTVTLELARINLQMAKEDRDFQWKMAQDKKEWDLKMEEFRDNREYRKAELAQKAKRDEFLQTLPAAIGDAFAKGVVSSSMGSVEGIASDAGHNNVQKQATNYKLQAGEGDAGEAVCPKCNAPIAIEPETTTAICVNCDSKYPVVRVPTERKQPPLAAAPTPGPYPQDQSTGAPV